MARKQGEFTSRTKARKRAADVIFEAEQRDLAASAESIQRLLAERRTLTAAQTPLPEYSQLIISGMAHNLGAIDKMIASHSKIKDLDRLPGVDLAVLRVAVWEMMFNSEDVDPIIAIDEAVAIAKSISTDRSPAFVNAVLDAIRKELSSAEYTPEDSSAKKLEESDDLWDELLDEY